MSRSKAIGTRGETKVTRYFCANGLPTERKALAGSNDKGDLRTFLKDGTEVTVEVKAGKQTSNYPRSRVEEWRKQTLAESENSGCPAILVIIRYNRLFEDAEVWMPNDQWSILPNGWTMMYINEFVQQYGNPKRLEMIGG